MVYRPTLLAAALLAQVAAPAFAGRITERVSVGADGGQADGASFVPSISANGRYVAFLSLATDLIPGDGNGTFDVFVRDVRAGTTALVSQAPDGRQADGLSYAPSLSAGGRFVAFHSEATNLVPGDSNGTFDVFVRDLQAGITQRVSLGAGGDQARGASFLPSVSAGGHHVAFLSEAANLVPGDSNNAPDIFVGDLRADTTERVSLGPGGGQADRESASPSISADGRYVAFSSYATNLVPGDGNDRGDIFVRDRRAGTTERVSLGPGGVAGDDNSFGPRISADGRYVAFYSFATSLVPGDTNAAADVFVRDRQAGTTTRVSVGPAGVQADGFSYAPAISAGGQYVAFESDATNLVPGDTNGSFDIFVHDLRRKTTARVSVGPAGRQADGAAWQPSIAAGGRVAFVAFASNLAPGDTNLLADIFVRRRQAP